MGTSIKIIMIAVLVFGFGNLSRDTKLLGVKVKKGQAKIFDKEYQMFTTYDTYTDLDGKFIVGFITCAKRNDTIFIHGKKTMEMDYIVFKEIYHYGISSYDSLERKLVKINPDKLMVTEVKRYKNGKIL